MEEWILILGEDFSFKVWLFAAVISIFQIRLHLYGIFRGCFAKYAKSFNRRLKETSKSQSFMRRLTFSYIGDYVTDRLRKPYKFYMVLKSLIDVWIVISGLLLIVFEYIDVNYEPELGGIIMSGFIVFNVLLLLLYNPNTRDTRFIDFMYHKD